VWGSCRLRSQGKEEDEDEDEEGDVQFRMVQLPLWVLTSRPRVRRTLDSEHMEMEEVRVEREEGGVEEDEERERKAEEALAVVVVAAAEEEEEEEEEWKVSGTRQMIMTRRSALMG